MLDQLPFLREIEVSPKQCEVSGSDVVTVRINAVGKELFSRMVQFTGSSTANSHGWYLSQVRCDIGSSSWVVGDNLVLENTPRTIDVAGCTLIENVVLIFRQIPDDSSERAQAIEDLLHGLY